MEEINKVTLLPEYYEAVQKLPKDLQIKFLGEIALYGMTGVEPDFEDVVLEAVFIAIKRVIDKSISFHKKQKENGKKGGRPKHKKSVTKKPTQNPNETHLKPNSNPNETHSKPKKNRTSTSTGTSTGNTGNAFTNANALPFEKKEKEKSFSKKNKNANSQNEQKFAVAGATVSNSQASCDETVDLFGNTRNAKPNLKLEYGFYLWIFNRYIGTKCRPTPKRWKLFQRRRKTFTLFELTSSVFSMGNNPFYRGEGGKDWNADPDYHLKSDENVNHFLESKNYDRYRAEFEAKYQERWEEYLAERKEKNA